MFVSTVSSIRASLVASAAALLAVTTACGGSSLSAGSESDGPVKVGLIGVLSGDFATIGEDQVRGFELFLEQNDQQLGGRDVELITADEGVEPSVAVAAAQRLLRQERVAVASGVSLSASALAIKDAFVESQVPLIVSTAGANEVTEGEPTPYLWRTSLANGQVGESMGEYVAEQVGDQGIYVLATDFAAGQETSDAFIESFEAAGGEVLGADFPPAGTADFQPFLDRAKSSGTGAVWAFFAGSDAVRFVQQYQDFGLGDIPLFGGGTLTDGAVLTAQGDDALGVQTALNYTHLLDNAENVEFVEAYREAYDTDPSGYAMQSYDSALLLDLAIDSIDGEVTPEAIAEAIADVGEIPSPRGPFILGEDHNPAQTFYMREVQELDGQLGNVVIAELGEF